MRKTIFMGITWMALNSFPATLAPGNSVGEVPKKGTFCGSTMSSQQTYMQRLNARQGLIALGSYNSNDFYFNDLKAFAQRLVTEKIVDYPVLIYPDFQWFGYARAYSDPAKVLDNVKYAIETAISKLPGQKVILYNLDGINLKRALGKYREIGYLNDELWMIVHNPLFLSVTAWYLNYRELDPTEVSQLLSEYLP
jgi:hypothetical protein